MLFLPREKKKDHTTPYFFMSSIMSCKGAFKGKHTQNIKLELRGNPASIHLAGGIISLGKLLKVVRSTLK